MKIGFNIMLFVALIAIALGSPSVFANNNATTITVMLGGYDPKGSGKDGLYGVPKEDNIINRVAELVGLPEGTKNPDAPNQIVRVRYYGKQAPSYYTPLDIMEIDAAGTGAPRYALIAAKFIKHRMQTTGATHFNLAGGSFGGLIGRYLIEQDLEGLASSNKIVRWLTIEGAVAGAYPANLTAVKEIREFFQETLQLDISDPITMSYPWVNVHINKPHNQSNCPYFKNILIGHQVSTNDDLNAQLLTLASNKPNDGVLLVEDQKLRLAQEVCYRGKQPLTVHTNTTHLSVKKDDRLMQNVASFVFGTKRVTISIKQAKAMEYTEEPEFGPGEVVFQGRLYSPYAQQKWNFNKDLATVTRQFHTAPIVKSSKGKGLKVDATLYDWMVHPEEKSLTLELWAEEIDWDEMYGIKEDMLNPYEDLGKSTLDIPVTEAGRNVYQVRGGKWEASVHVEVYDYSQPQYNVAAQQVGSFAQKTNFLFGEGSHLNISHVSNAKKIEGKNFTFTPKFNGGVQKSANILYEVTTRGGKVVERQNFTVRAFPLTRPIRVAPGQNIIKFTYDKGSAQQIRIDWE